MRNVKFLLLVMFMQALLIVTNAPAEEKTVETRNETTADSKDITREDAKIVEMMEILEIMDILEDLDMMRDLDILIGED